MNIYLTSDSFNFVDKNDNFFGFRPEDIYKSDNISYVIKIREINNYNDIELPFNPFFGEGIHRYEDYSYQDCTAGQYINENKEIEYIEDEGVFKVVSPDINGLFFSDSFDDFYIESIDMNRKSFIISTDSEELKYEFVVDAGDYCEFYNSYEFDYQFNNKEELQEKEKEKEYKIRTDIEIAGMKNTPDYCINALTYDIETFYEKNGLDVNVKVSFDYDKQPEGIISLRYDIDLLDSDFSQVIIDNVSISELGDYTFYDYVKSKLKDKLIECSISLMSTLMKR